MPGPTGQHPQIVTPSKDTNKVTGGAARSWGGTLASIVFSTTSAITGFVALGLAASLVGAEAAPVFESVSLASGAAATAIDCTANLNSFSCGLGIASLAAGPVFGSIGRLTRAASGTVKLVREAANAGLIPAGFASAVGGLPSLWE